MKRQLELKAELTRRGMRYRDLARALRGRGLEAEEGDILSVVNGKRCVDDAFKRNVSEILGRPSYELFA